jgi:hypothetical protein
MSFGSRPKLPEPAPPPPPPPPPTPVAPVIGDEGRASRRGRSEANRRGTSSLRTDLSISPAGSGMDPRGGSLTI